VRGELWTPDLDCDLVVCDDNLRVAAALPDDEFQLV
jgi:hypothetical protein